MKKKELYESIMAQLSYEELSGYGVKLTLEDLLRELKRYPEQDVAKLLTPLELEAMEKGYNIS